MGRIKSQQAVCGTLLWMRLGLSSVIEAAWFCARQVALSYIFNRTCSVFVNLAIVANSDLRSGASD